MTDPAARRRHSPAGRLAAHGVLILLAIPFVLPLVWMVSTSLKTDAQIFPREGSAEAQSVITGLVPNPVAWENYPAALTTVPFASYLWNTTLLCLCTVILAVFSSAMVAWGFARMRFRGREALFALLLMTMALPGQVTMVPLFILFRELGWYGTYLPLIVPACFGTPFFIFLMRQFFLTIPVELLESARIEGASEWRIFWTIALPLSRPVLATCALFQFLWCWNDFLGPMLYLNDPSSYTLAYGLQQFMSAFDGKYAQLMAASTVFILPVIVLFFFAQRTFIQGIATTGSKG